MSGAMGGAMNHPVYRVRSFEIVSPYTLRLRFDDGTEQTVDFRPVLAGELYGPLRRAELFNQVRIDPEVETLVWPNGADFDPATLHDWPQHEKAFRELAQSWQPEEGLTMPDCFISYSSHDQRLANFVFEELTRHNVTAFMASVSLLPGQHWSSEILTNLQSSNWVILLASRAACASAFVNQEVGGALLSSKHLVPIVWDIRPAELPGWASGIQAIDLRGCTTLDLQYHVEEIANRIKQEKRQGLLIVGAVVLGLWALGSAGK